VRRWGLNSSGSSYRRVAGSCEHGNEPSGSKIGGKFLDLQSYFCLLEKNSAL
jgi:hypothetical protein